MFLACGLVFGAVALLPPASTAQFAEKKVLIGVRREFADAHPDVIRRLIRGTVMMQRWIAANEAEARDVSNATLGISGAVGAKVRMPYFLANGLTVMPNMWHMYYLLLAGKVIDPVENPAKMFDEYFVKSTERFTLPALQELGIKPDPVSKQMLTASYPMLPKPPQICDALAIVKPDTIVGWHRAGFRLYWRWRSRRRGGRPKVPLEIRRLIREMSIANPLWGAPRLHGDPSRLVQRTGVISSRAILGGLHHRCARV
jgi:hypothetical protein